MKFHCISFRVSALSQHQYKPHRTSPTSPPKLNCLPKQKSLDMLTSSYGLTGSDKPDGPASTGTADGLTCPGTADGLASPGTAGESAGRLGRRTIHTDRRSSGTAEAATSRHPSTLPAVSYTYLNRIDAQEHVTERNHGAHRVC